MILGRHAHVDHVPRILDDLELQREVEALGPSANRYGKAMSCLWTDAN
jgi:hypothetical protein